MQTPARCWLARETDPSRITRSLALEADDRVNLSADVVELSSARIGEGAANAAAHHADLLLALGLGIFAQGAHKVLEAVALLHVAEFFLCGAHGLDNDGDGVPSQVVGIDRNGMRSIAPSTAG